MNHATPQQRLDERIHSVRRAVRSRQPLQQRIDLVRSRVKAFQAEAAKRGIQHGPDPSQRHSL
ncbi:MAG TPA: hypothetical protein PLA50_12965 [Bacteroidia bacterium]|nr:hypothetical protein [Bacteroidia bacterium]